MGYAVPASGSNDYYVQDWDYQNLLPKSYFAPTTAIVNPKFFMDMVRFSATVATRIVYTGTDVPAGGSHAGRFNKGTDWSTTTSGPFMSTRCAILSP